LQRRPPGPETGRGSKPSAISLLRVAEGAEGAGHRLWLRDLSATWPCLALQGALTSLASQPLPQNNGLWHQPSTIGPGLQRTECPIDRGVVPSTLSALSFRQLAKPGRWEAAARPPYTKPYPHSILPRSQRCFQQTGGGGHGGHGAASARPEPAARRRRHVCPACRAVTPVGCYSPEKPKDHTRRQPDARKGYCRRAHLHVEIHPSRHVGMYDGGAPGQASGRLTWLGPPPLLIPPCLVARDTCRRQYNSLSNYSRTFHSSSEGACVIDYTPGANSSLPGAIPGP